MQEPDPMRQIHKIREKIYEDTKHMSHKEFIGYIEKKAARVDKLIKKSGNAKDLENFFKELKQNKKAG